MVSLPTHTAAPPELLMELSSDQPPSGQSSDCFGHPLAASSQTAWPTAAYKTSTNKVGFSFIASTYFKALVTIYRSLNTELPYHTYMGYQRGFQRVICGLLQRTHKNETSQLPEIGSLPSPKYNQLRSCSDRRTPKAEPLQKGKEKYPFFKKTQTLGTFRQFWKADPL